MHPTLWRGLKWLIKNAIDLGIIIVALWYIMLSVAPAEGMMHIFTTDGQFVALVVVGTYIVLVVLAEILVVLGGMVSDVWYAKGARFLITTLIVILGFPWAIKRIFWIAGLQVAANVEDILFYTAFIRYIIRFWLGRRFSNA